MLGAPPRPGGGGGAGGQGYPLETLSNKNKGLYKKNCIENYKYHDKMICKKSHFNSSLLCKSCKSCYKMGPTAPTKMRKKNFS